MTDADRAALAHDLRVAEGDGGKPRLRAYRDSVGVWTIGYGVNLQELTIDYATAEAWLDNTITACERECERFPWFAVLDPVRQRAVMELVYNLGMPRLLGFTHMLRAFARRDFARAAAELMDSRWAQQVGPRRAERLKHMVEQG